MLASSAYGTPGVSVYRWCDGSLAEDAQLDCGVDGASSVVINCNNQVLALASVSGGVNLQLPDPKRPPLYSFELGGAVRSLSFDPTSRYLACGGAFHNVVVWDLKKRKKVRELKGHAEGAATTTAVRFSPDGQQLASGSSGAFSPSPSASSSSSDVLVHGVREKQLLAKLCRPSLPSSSSTAEKSISQSKALTTAHQQHPGVGQVEWSVLRPGVVGAAYTDGALAVFDLASLSGNATVAPLAFWPSLHTPTMHDGSNSGSFGALSFSPLNHKFLASAGGDGVLTFVDYDTQKVVKELSPENCGALSACAFLDGVYVAAGTASGQLLLFDLRRAASPVQTFHDHSPGCPVTSLHFHEATSEVQQGDTASQASEDATSVASTSLGISFSAAVPAPAPPSLATVPSALPSVASLAVPSPRATSGPAAALASAPVPAVPAAPSFTGLRRPTTPPLPAAAAGAPPQHEPMPSLDLMPLPPLPPLPNDAALAGPGVLLPSTRANVSTVADLREPAIPSKAPSALSPPPAEAPSNSSSSVSPPRPATASAALATSPRYDQTTTSSSSSSFSGLAVPPDAPPPPVLQSPPASARVATATVAPLPSQRHSNHSSVSSLHRGAEDASITALRENGDGVNDGHDGNSRSRGMEIMPSSGLVISSTTSTSSLPLPPPESLNVVLSDYEELQKRLAANEEAMRNFSLGAYSNQPKDSTTSGAGVGVASAAHQSNHPDLNGYTSNSTSVLNGGGGLSSGDGRLERRAVEECLRGALSENRKELRRDIQNLHLDMLRQFEEQQQAINLQLEAHADKIASLVAENQQLRRENAELRRMY